MDTERNVSGKKPTPSKKQRKRKKDEEAEKLKDYEDSKNDEKLVNEEEAEDKNEESHMDAAETTSKGRDYEVLGCDEVVETTKVTVVPVWMQHSTRISDKLNEDTKPLTSIQGLTSQLLDKLREQNIKHWFPVQKMVIPQILKEWTPLPPRDICVSAPTGSGKTLCYVLPIIQKLQNRMVPAIRALIMLPVQDLAIQVYRVFETYSSGTKLQVVLLTGQQSLQSEREKLWKNTSKGKRCVVDIVIATPGRLIDHLWADDELGVDLQNLQYLVIDEADRMLSGGGLDWLKMIEQEVYEPEGKLNESNARFRASAAVNCTNLFKCGSNPLLKILLSATLSHDPEQLQQFALFQPKLFKVNTATKGSEGSCTEVESYDGAVTLPSELVQQFILCENSRKPLAVFVYLKKNPQFQKVLCFVGSSEASQRLSTVLKHLLGPSLVAECSKNLLRKRRDKHMKDFTLGKLRILICSDLVARGMDLSGVACVINYTPPRYAKTYVHRAGRTARAGKTGTVITVLDSVEKPYFDKLMVDAKIERDLGEVKIEPAELKEYSADYKDALKQLREKSLAQKEQHLKRTGRYRMKPKFKRK